MYFIMFHYKIVSSCVKICEYKLWTSIQQCILLIIFEMHFHQVEAGFITENQRNTAKRNNTTYNYFKNSLPTTSNQEFRNKNSTTQ